MVHKQKKLKFLELSIHLYFFAISQNFNFRFIAFYEYMAALAHLKKGDKAKIEILRNGKKVKVNAQF